MYKRLQQLENNIAELNRFASSVTVEEIKNDTTKEWALRYGLLETIQIMIDISCHLVVHHNLGNAETYADCIDLLHQSGYINSDLEKKLKGMTGLRNILVHEYVTIDLDRLYAMLDHLEDFKTFSRSVKQYLTS